MKNPSISPFSVTKADAKISRPEPLCSKGFRKKLAIISPFSKATRTRIFQEPKSIGRGAGAQHISISV